MPGSSHDVDPSFMDAVPLAMRDPALDMIRYASLREMLLMRQEGPSDYYRNKYSLTPSQWQFVLNAVILTKVSYFQITTDFPDAYIDKLVEIAAYAHGVPGSRAQDLYQMMLNDHPIFANWLKTCLVVKQQKARQQHASQKTG